MHIFHYKLIKWHVWLSYRCHFRRNNICICLITIIFGLKNISCHLTCLSNIIIIIDRDYLTSCLIILLLLNIICNLRSYCIIWILSHRILSKRLHQIIWLQLIWYGTIDWGIRLSDGSRSRISHILRYHISIVLVYWIVFVAVWVYIDFVKLMINFWFEKLLDHCSSILGSQFLS